MTMDTDYNSRTGHLIGLKRVGKYFVQADFEDNLLDSGESMDQLQRRLARTHELEQGEVHVSSGIFHADVYLPKDDSDVPYTIIDDEGLPLGADTPSTNVSGDLATTVDHVRKLCQYAEQIYDSYTRDLSCQYITPRISKVNYATWSRSETISWEQTLDLNRLVIIGNAGMGKTTFARRFALDYCYKFRDPTVRPVAPLYVSMRRWKRPCIDREGLIEFLEEDREYNLKGRLEGFLKEGNLLLIFDGLDEVPEADENKMFDDVQALCSEYPLNKFLVTTRTQPGSLDKNEFDVLKLEPFDNSQIKKWFHNTALPIQFSSLAFGAIASTFGMPYVLPLIMPMTKWLLKKSKKQKPTKSEMYEEYISLMLGDWDKQRGIKRYIDIWDNYGDKRTTIEQIAFESACRNRDTFSDDDVCDWFKNYKKRDLLSLKINSLVSESILLHDSVNSWFSFPHRSIKDYLAASFVMRSSESASSLLDKVWNQPNWQDIWVYCMTMGYPSDSLFVELMDSDKESKYRKVSMILSALQGNAHLTDENTSRALTFLTETIKGINESASNRRLKDGDELSDRGKKGPIYEFAIVPEDGEQFDLGMLAQDIESVLVKISEVMESEDHPDLAHWVGTIGKPLKFMFDSMRNSSSGLCFNVCPTKNQKILIKLER